MGLFDKLRGNDDGEEVELKPPREPSFERAKRRITQGSRGQPQNRPPEDVEGEVELEDMWDQNRKRRRTRSRRGGASRQGNRNETAGSDGSDNDEFILPGMKSVSTQADGRATEDREGIDGETGDKLDRLLDQNERIISLLEDIAGEYGQDDEEGTNLGNADMW